MIHSSGDSGVVKRDDRGEAEIAFGFFRNMLGALCARSRASPGDKFVGGCSKNEAIVGDDTDSDVDAYSMTNASTPAR